MEISLTLNEIATLVHIMLNELELQEEADLAIKEKIDFIEDDGSNEYDTAMHNLVETGPFNYGDFDDEDRGQHTTTFSMTSEELARLINIIKPVSDTEHEISLVQKLESLKK